MALSPACPLAMDADKLIDRGADSSAGADVVLLRKSDRAEWLDCIAVDPAVSDNGYRVAGGMACHFNWRDGRTFIKQRSLARLLEKSESTVWAGIHELEVVGYLIVRRNELGVRVDGRRVAGGRGVANEYLPAFKGSRIAATTDNKKLSAYRDLLLAKAHDASRPSAGKRSRFDAQKVPTDRVPTLTLPTEGNSGRACAREDNDQFGLVWEALSKAIGNTEFGHWFSDRNVVVDEVTEHRVTLAVLTRFIRNWISTHFEIQLLRCWQPSTAGHKPG